MDKYTETKTTGYFNRIGDSIKGCVFGLIIIPIAFITLYINEGRYDLSKLARQTVEISSIEIANKDLLQGAPVSVTGNISTSEMLGDNLYLKPINVIALGRVVEMYSWVEDSKSDSHSNTGGSETTSTTYNYSKKWMVTPQDSSKFKQFEEHFNPEKSLQNVEYQTSAAKIGVYKVNPQFATLPEFQDLFLTDEDLIRSADYSLASNKYLFIKKGKAGTIENPDIGDLRIKYVAFKPQSNITVMGSLNQDEVNAYVDRDGHSLYRIFYGNREDSIKAMHTEYTWSLWALRLLGFLLIWVGFSAIFGPFSVILDFFPILGSLGRFGLILLTFVTSLVLSLLVIFLSIILHNPILIMVIIGLVMLGFGTIMYMKRPNTVN